MSSVWYLFNVVMVCSGQFFFLLFDILRAIGEGGYLSLDAFLLPVSHHFDTVKLKFKASWVFVSCGKMGVYSLKRCCMELPSGKTFS